MFVGYARVSTQEQDPALQLDALRRAGCEKLFVEHASGALRERPQLALALAEMQSGDDVLVVWKLDRLARSLSQLITTIERLEQRRIGFRSLTEAISTSSAGGRLVFHIFGAMAEFERGMARERTLAGLAAARVRGSHGGRPSALTPKDIVAARALLGDPNITVEEVAKRLNVGASTLYRHLPGGRSSLRSFDDSRS